jgi:hypothetical protein
MSSRVFLRFTFAGLIVLSASCATNPRQGNIADFNCENISRSPALAYQCGGSYAQPYTAQRTFEALKTIRNEDLTTKDIQAMYEPIKYQRDWAQMHDDAFWGSLIGYERTVRARAEGKEPIMVFGEETSFNYNAALRRMNEIPIGKLQISELMVSEVNRDIVSAYQTHLRFLKDDLKTKRFQYPSRILRAVNSYISKFGGRFKGRQLFAFKSLFTPMSEADYQQSLNNHVISGIRFKQAPWSRPGKRYGIFLYPDGKQMFARFEKLMAETNHRMQEIREGRSTEDPIALAAEFQWRFVQLHPMVDGNGRTSRAIMNRILAEFGLPPSARKDIGVDLTLTLEQQVSYVRNGVIDALRLILRENKKGELTLPDGRVTIYRKGFGTRFNTNEIREIAKGILTERNITSAGELVPSSEAQIFTIKDKRFTLGEDFFLHDEYGVPHTVSFENGRFEVFPIADRTYVLYSMGGKYTGEKKVQFAMPEHTLALARDTLELIRQNNLPGELARSEVTIHKYETIERANINDKYVFHQWQIPMLLEVTRINENPLTDPQAVLVRNRGFAQSNSFVGRSKFEDAFFEQSGRSDVPQVIGHYLRADQTFHQLKRGIQESELLLQKKELQGQLLKQIEESREKLHVAGRELLKPFTEKLASLTKEDLNYLMAHPQFKLLYEYYIRTPLAFSKLSEAQARLGDSVIPVMRSQSGDKVGKVGFISDVQMRNFLLGLPFIGPKFEKLVHEINGELIRLKEEKEGKEETPLSQEQTTGRIARLVAAYGQTNPSVQGAVRALLEYILVQPYALRRLDPEMGRAFVTQYLHTQLDAGPKHLLSTTTNPEYLLNQGKNAPENELYARFAWNDPTIYIIMANRDKVHIDISSGFIVQMEAGMEPMGPLAARKAVAFKLRTESTNESGTRNAFYLPATPATQGAADLMALTFNDGLGLVKDKAKPTTPEVQQ